MDSFIQSMDGLIGRDCTSNHCSLLGVARSMAAPLPTTTASSASSPTSSFTHDSVRSSHVASRIENELLTCVICSERYESAGKVPKVLPCVHTFCLECLQQLLRHGRSSSIACPNCRAACSIPEGDARHLPNNLNILDLLDIMQGSSSMAAASSTSAAAAAAPSTTAATITSRSMAQPSPDGNGGPSDDVCCCLKHQVIVQYFCLSCQVLVCPQCLLDEHRDHSAALVNDWLRRCRQEITERRMLVAAYRTTLGSRMDTLLTNKGTVPDMRTRVQSEINAAFGAMANALAIRQRALLETLNAAVAEREDQYDQRIDACAMRMAVISSCIDRLSNDSTPIPTNNAPPPRRCLQAITDDIVLLRDLDSTLSTEPDNEILLLPSIVFAADTRQLEQHIAQFGALAAQDATAHSQPAHSDGMLSATEQHQEQHQQQQPQLVALTPIFRGSELAGRDPAPEQPTTISMQQFATSTAPQLTPSALNLQRRKKKERKR